MLLNLAVFMWFGAVCPWATFLHNDVIPLYRLVILGVVVLLFRRLPVVYAMHWKISQIEEKHQALFVGFFGPIGVSAVFYLYISLEFLGEITVDGVVREDAAKLQVVMTVVVWFLAICSIVSGGIHACNRGVILLTTRQVVHGLSVPLGKLGYHLPRTISSAIESRDLDQPEPFRISEHVQQSEDQILRHRRRLPKEPRAPDASPPRPVFRIGGTLIRPGHDGHLDAAEPQSDVVPMDDRPHRRNSAAGSTPKIPSAHHSG